jgi:hypothetical protein
MSIWFPTIEIRQLPTLLRVTVVSALFAGVYGAIHDQISYTISEEYFSKVKFRQFAFADFGLPPRVFAAEIGFLGSWWVGLIGGWVLARKGLADLSERTRWYNLGRALAIVAVVAMLVGTLGALLGAVQAQRDARSWSSWESGLGLEDLAGFIIVAYLHWGSYLGGLLGVLVALIDVRRSLALTVAGLGEAISRDK